MVGEHAARQETADAPVGAEQLQHAFGEQLVAVDVSGRDTVHAASPDEPQEWLDSLALKGTLLTSTQVAAEHLPRRVGNHGVEPPAARVEDVGELEGPVQAAL